MRDGKGKDGVSAIAATAVRIILNELAFALASMGNIKMGRGDTEKAALRAV